jgi:pyruvate,water dikinase
MSNAKSYIRWFEEIGIGDVSLVGGKNASLGELYRELAPQGVSVPDGFAITAEAYWELLRRGQLDRRIKEILAGLDTRDTANLQQRGSAIRRDLVSAALPGDLQKEIVAAYHELCEDTAEPVDVADVEALKLHRYRSRIPEVYRVDHPTLSPNALRFAESASLPDQHLPAMRK